ncbi:ferritin-like domain-containing protein [Peribacillus kribbensis]|uniref:ferritin-like domain-containing protein n=1 Tax=Peribacillus kribbensis TaxID=356658 RepID=UPI00040EA434|nr:ferritin-like domain-containing protein [Peribacillus kribbensis]
MEYSYMEYARQNEEIRREIGNAINGEYTAIICYEKIASMAPTEAARNQILEIRKDEIHHYQTFVQIYSTLFGRQPQVQIREECPRDYRRGLDFAFKDEQETVDKYHRIAQMTNDPSIREAFRSAAADEQNHAVWFLYFMVHRI